MSKQIIDPQACEASASGRQFVTALARGLSILRCFDQPQAELSVSELARRVGLSQPTVWRLCYTLLECGFLVRGPTGTGLRIGAPAITLGYAAAYGLQPPAIALPYMQRLTAKTGGSATLSLRGGAEMISVEQCSGHFVLPNQPVGWRALLETVSSGLAVIAAIPMSDRDAAIQVIRHRDPAKWPRHSERIEAAVAQFERDGYVSLAGMLGGHYTAVAVPLFEAGQAPASQWALTCGGLSTGWTQESLAGAADCLREIRALLVPAFAALAQ